MGSRKMKKSCLWKEKKKKERKKEGKKKGGTRRRIAEHCIRQNFSAHYSIIVEKKIVLFPLISRRELD